MNSLKSMALAVASAVALAAAGISISAEESGERNPSERHAAEAGHKGGQGHGHGMQRMGDKHDAMGGMHKRMMQHGKGAAKQDSKKPEAEEHKH